MRILHVLNHSAPEIDGYSLRSAALLREQRNAGLETVALTSPRAAVAAGDVSEEIDGSRYYRTARVAPSRLPLVQELREMARLRRRIESVAREEGVEVVHAHSPPLWGWAARSAARRLGLPFVYEIRALWEDAAVADGRVRFASPRYRLSRALETRVLRGADVVVVICEALRREVCGRGFSEDDVVVVPNGVEVEAFRPRPRDAALAAELGLETDSTVIGYIGSLRSWEGVGDLIRAAPALARCFPELRLVIVGDGDMKPRLEAAIRELGVSSQVRLVSAVSASEVRRYYSLLDVVVYPRRQSRLTEMTTPLKPLEAMAMAKAIVVSDVGGLRELVGSAALSYASGDVDGLGSACSELISRPELRASLGEEARVRVSQRHTWTSAARIYRDVYATAVGRRR